MHTGTPIISVRNLSKEYKVAHREEGLVGAIKYLFSRKYEIIRAVDGVSFDIYPGELVGYTGRNGAGKSTTIKMLTGVLVPTSGQLYVDGIVPHRHRAENGQKIGVVFGQRTQLKWDIPVIESLRLLREIYQVPMQTFRENLELFSDVLELDGLLSRPVRKLSLGQRMKCDLAASFLHNPKIIYLDEPTIGLDIIVKENIRTFIKAINKERGATIILTTNDLDDVDNICERIIIIDRGKIVYDGRIEEIKARFGQHKFLTFEIRDWSADGDDVAKLPSGAELLEVGKHRIKLCIDREVISPSTITRFMIDHYDVQDISIEESSIESIVKRIYQDGWDESTQKRQKISDPC